MKKLTVLLFALVLFNMTTYGSIQDKKDEITKPGNCSAMGHTQERVIGKGDEASEPLLNTKISIPQTKIKGNVLIY